MKNLLTVWTKHLKTPKEKQDFERLLRGNVTVNIRLVQILKEMKDGTIPKIADYDSPSWPYLQADRNGYNRCLSDLLALFEFMEK